MAQSFLWSFLSVRQRLDERTFPISLTFLCPYFSLHPFTFPIAQGLMPQSYITVLAPHFSFKGVSHIFLANTTFCTRISPYHSNLPPTRVRNTESENLSAVLLIFPLCGNLLANVYILCQEAAVKAAYGVTCL